MGLLDQLAHQNQGLGLLGNTNKQSVLSPEQSIAYKEWVKANSVPQSQNYDMQGFWKEAQTNPNMTSSINEGDGQLHYPDTYKFPTHPSFSTESKYYNPKTMPETPSWVSRKTRETGDGIWDLTYPNGEIKKTDAPFYGAGQSPQRDFDGGYNKEWLLGITGN
jgi:hypothetical protein